MSPIIKNLCWKEFHELKSGTLSATAVTLAIPLCYVFRDVNAAFFSVFPTFYLYPLAAGVFFGMRAAAGERTSRTATFSAALPVSHRLLGATRLLATLIATAFPLVALLLLGMALSPYADHRTMESVLPLTIGFGLSLFATVCCITLAATAGMGQPTEVRAGAVGLAGIVIVGFLGWFFIVFCWQWLMWLGLAEPERVFELVFFGIILPGAAALLFAARFIANYSLALGLSAEPNGRSRSVGGWSPTPIPAPLAALVWKGYREMGVLGLQVLLGTLLLSFFLGAIYNLDSSSHSLIESVLKILPVFLWVAGFILAILIGVGSAIADLQPGVNTFWRSRPISPRDWYWTKFGIGLATLLVAIEIPSLLCVGSTVLEIKDLRDLLLFWLLWSTTFSFALTATCLVRQPASAAILALGGVGILFSILQAIFGGPHDEPLAAMPALITAFLAAFLLSTLLGAYAADRDLALS